MTLPSEWTVITAGWECGKALVYRSVAEVWASKFLLLDASHSHCIWMDSTHSSLGMKQRALTFSSSCRYKLFAMHSNREHIHRYLGWFLVCNILKKVIKCTECWPMIGTFHPLDTIHLHLLHSNVVLSPQLLEGETASIQVSSLLMTSRLHHIQMKSTPWFSGYDFQCTT